MPHLVQMDKKYSKKGMVMVGAEVQGSSPDAIKKMAADHKLQFTITKGISGPSLSRGIPHMAVFDVKGDLVYHGHPSNPATEKAIKDALKDATPPGTASAGNNPFAKPKYLIDERTWTKKVLETGRHPLGVGGRLTRRPHTDGKTLKAAMIALEGNIGKFRFSNGHTFNYDITKLSEEDQTLIKSKAAPGEKEKEAEYQVDERTWTDKEGKTLEAAMLSLKNNIGKFRMPNGRTFNFDITKLSEEDQTLIKDKAAPGKKRTGSPDNKFDF